jgi:hypothetical protein
MTNIEKNERVNADTHSTKIIRGISRGEKPECERALAQQRQSKWEWLAQRS